jgi:hypothetical protein
MKRVKPSQILIGLFTLTGVVFGILTLVKKAGMNGAIEDYVSSVSKLDSMYSPNAKSFKAYTQQIEDDFHNLESWEVQKIKRYANSKQLPSPTKENMELAKENLTVLRETRSSHERDLMGGGNLGLHNEGAPNFELTVQQGIRNYALKMRSLAQNKKIRLEKDGPIEDFGFSNYVGQTVNTNNKALAVALDKQRAILEYLVGKLVEAEPQEILSVRRENIENTFASTIQVVSSDVFLMDPKKSAKVPGAIETQAFFVEFSGYTDTLRKFFNELSKFEIPVVVRDVRVSRKLTVEEDEEDEEEAKEEPAMAPGSNQPFPQDSPFPFPGSAPAPVPATPPPPPPPAKAKAEVVVDKNVSIFSVTIEFVELSQPEEEDIEGEGDEE